MKAQLVPNFDGILSYAIAKKQPLSFSLKSPEDWQLFKSQFSDGDPSWGIRMNEPALCYGPDAGYSGSVAVSFRHGHKKMIFQTQTRKNTLIWPNRMVQVKRRIFQRQCPPGTTVVRFWKEKEPHKIFYGQVENISAAGLAASTRDVHNKGSYICAIPTKPPLVLEAILIKNIEHKKRVTVSFQFIGVDSDPLTHLNRIGKVLGQWNRSRDFNSTRFRLH